MGLRFFAIVYTTITLVFIRNIYADQSASLGHVYIFPVFWIIGGIILGGLFYWKKIKLKTKWDWVTLNFATPIPTILFFIIGATISERASSTYEFNKNGHRHRIVTFDHKNGKPKRKEFYRSKDTVTEENPFPANDIWLKDSIWIYYDLDGKMESTETFGNGEQGSR